MSCDRCTWLFWTVSHMIVPPGDWFYEKFGTKGASDGFAWEKPKKCASATAEHKVSQRPDRLEERRQHPRWLGASDAVGGTASKISKSYCGEDRLNRTNGIDRPLLGGAEV